MSADQRPYVPEQLAPVIITDQTEREYFKNLSRRLLSRIFHNMVILPPATTIVGVIFNAGAEQVDFLKSLVPPSLEYYALSGFAVGAVLSAREIWKVRNERFPRS